MHIQRHSMGAFLKLTIGLLSLAGLLYEWVDLDMAALRLFSFWFLLVSTIYFLTLSVKTVFMSHHPDQTRSPVLEGALLVAGVVMCIGFVLIKSTGSFTKYPICDLVGQQDTEDAQCNIFWEGIGSPYISAEDKASLNFLWPVIIYLFLPTLIFLDWILFTKKGRWRFVDPVYWLAPLVIYVSVILLTAGNAEWGYPYRFLDYTRGADGIHDAALWVCFGAIMTFCFGYFLLLLDYAASGKLSKHIVLPHIRTVVIEEEEVSPPGANEKHLEESAELSQSLSKQEVGQSLPVNVKGDEGVVEPANGSSVKKNSGSQEEVRSDDENQSKQKASNKRQSNRGANKKTISSEAVKNKQKTAASNAISAGTREDGTKKMSATKNTSKKKAEAQKLEGGEEVSESPLKQKNRTVIDNENGKMVAKVKSQGVAAEMNSRVDKKVEQSGEVKGASANKSKKAKKEPNVNRGEKQETLQEFVVPTVVKKKDNNESEANEQVKISRSPKIKKFASFSIPDEKSQKVDSATAKSQNSSKNKAS